MNEKRPNILYVDDEIENTNAFKASFRRFYNTFTAYNLAEAKKILENNEIAVLLSDQRIGKELGTSLLEFAEKNYPNLIRILVSGFPNTSEINLAITQGTIYSFIQKPWIVEELKLIIDDGLVVHAKIKQLNKKQTELKEKLKNYEEQIKLLKKQLYN